MKAYETLKQRFEEMNRLDSIAAMLQWDAAVNLPEGASALRGEQLAYLAEASHALLVAPELHELLDRAAQEVHAPWDVANVQEMQHQRIHATCLEGSLVAAMSKAASESERVWRTARKHNDFKSFAPYLENMITLVREAAHAKAEALGLSPYDALLDGYDPTTRSADIDALFAPLEDALPVLIPHVLEHQAREARPPLDLHASETKQKKLGKRVMQQLGFPFENGRLDTSTHPFCGGVPHDIRITTRYNRKDFTESLYGVLHETGHALYEAGLPKAWVTQPVGQARGMSLHESQSLFIEMQVSLSHGFSRFIAPLITQELGLEGITPDVLHHHVTRVTPSFIRVNADEVTYPTHILLRYRLEKQLLSGELHVAELPEAWAQMQEKLLGICPPSDTQGCLQDIHWPEGAIGYFPTYTLGAMIAAQLMAALRQEMPDIEEQFARGEFAPMRQWLRTHVHAHASSLPMQEIVTQTTGKKLSAEDYLAHIRVRYL